MKLGKSIRRTLRYGLPGFVLSFINLAGAFLTIAALGGLGAWSDWQFIGFFAAVEVATGIAFVIGPNIWHLPVAQGDLGDRTRIQLAASTILIPHWAAVAKAVGGLVLLVTAMWKEGAGPATLGLLPFMLAIVAAVLGVSLLAARWGVARPDLDVYTFVIRRPKRPEHTLPGISLSASVVQLLTNLGAFPLVKVMAPGSFYRPEMGPSPGVLAFCLVIGLPLLAVGLIAWQGRIRWHAPRAQQRDAEKVA
jgi:hypothetical protein